MIAIIVFAAAALYLLVSVWVVYKVAKVARQEGINPWLPGIIAALVMYLLVFWDHIPVLVKHHNLCKEQGGFWIYKTPEQWFKENPEAVGKKWGDQWNESRYEVNKNVSRSWLSDYLYLETKVDPSHSHAIRRYESKIIDARNGEVLARMIDFERGGRNALLHADSTTDYKIWLGIGKNTCGVDTFGEVTTKFKNMGRGSE